MRVVHQTRYKTVNISPFSFCLGYHLPITISGHQSICGRQRASAVQLAVQRGMHAECLQIALRTHEEQEKNCLVLDSCKPSRRPLRWLAARFPATDLRGSTRRGGVMRAPGGSAGGHFR